MTGLRFEFRGEEYYYKAILHIGDCYVPVTDDIIDELKHYTASAADKFLSVLIDKVGYSSYLKEQIQAELTKSDNSGTEISALQQSLQVG